MIEAKNALVATAALRVARKAIIAVLGTTVLAVGVALIVLPGPAIVLIPLGLTILATEFLWARRLLNRVKQGTTQARERHGHEKGGRPTAPRPRTEGERETSAANGSTAGTRMTEVLRFYSSS